MATDGGPVHVRLRKRASSSIVIHRHPSLSLVTFRLTYGPSELWQRIEIIDPDEGCFYCFHAGQQSHSQSMNQTSNPSIYQSIYILIYLFLYYLFICICIYLSICMSIFTTCTFMFFFLFLFCMKSKIGKKMLKPKPNEKSTNYHFSSLLSTA